MTQQLVNQAEKVAVMCIPPTETGFNYDYWFLKNIIKKEPVWLLFLCNISKLKIKNNPDGR
jgi:hypothetical protein